MAAALQKRRSRACAPEAVRYTGMSAQAERRYGVARRGAAAGGVQKRSALTATGLEKAGRNINGRIDMNHFRHLAVAVAGGAMLTAACAFSAPAFAAGPEVVAGPAYDPLLCAVDGQDEVLQVAGQEGPVPHRACQRIHRQHLAHPDDPDGQGVRGAARHRRPAQGIQGRLDRRGRRRADRRDQQLHRFRLRRDRRQRPESGGVQAGDQARE